MDPNETLRRIRAELDQAEWTSETIEHVAEHFQALDEWLSKGGSLPESWDQHPRW